jgi:hypothetical protein
MEPQWWGTSGIGFMFHDWLSNRDVSRISPIFGITFVSRVGIRWMSSVNRRNHPWLGLWRNLNFSFPLKKTIFLSYSNSTKKNYFNKRKTSVDRSISHLPPVNRLCEIFFSENKLKLKLKLSKGYICMNMHR